MGKKILFSAKSVKAVYHVYMILIDREAVWICFWNKRGNVTIVNQLSVSDYNQYSIMIFCLIALIMWSFSSIVVALSSALDIMHISHGFEDDIS